MDKKRAESGKKVLILLLVLIGILLMQCYGEAFCDSSNLSPNTHLNINSFRQTYRRLYSDFSTEKLEDFYSSKNQLERQRLLINKIRDNFKSSADFSQATASTLEKILSFAQKTYAQRKFDSGEFYFSHTLEVAGRISEWDAAIEMISCALLHRLSDKEIKKLAAEGINAEFIDEVIYLKNAFLRISEFSYSLISLNDKYGLQNFMNCLIQMVPEGDSRVMRLVFADKLASIVTASEIEKDEFSKEAEDVYGPMAYRMGLTDLADEFINEVFKINRTVEYNIIIDKIKRTFGVSYEDIKEYIHLKEKDIKAALKKYKAEHGLEHDIDVTLRVKKPYQIFVKEQQLGAFQNKGLAINDLLGVRLTCDCDIDFLYQFLQFVKNEFGEWKPQGYEEKFDDEGLLGGIYLDLGENDSFDGLRYEIQMLTKYFHEERESRNRTIHINCIKEPANPLTLKILGLLVILTLILSVCTIH